MPYVDLAGLSRFAGKSKDFASSACAGLDMANWQKTPAAGAVSFAPVPEMPLDPVVNFLFTETGPASGTKGPENPSTFTGVSSVKVTRCGKNLLKYPYSSGSKTESGVTFTMSSDGSVLINGTATSNIYYYPAYVSYSPILVQGRRYAISGCPAGGSLSTYYFRYFGYIGTGEYDIGNGGTFVANASGRIGNVALLIMSGTTATNLVFKPQLEEASVATSFELYEGNDYTIDLGSTYFGGSVDLSTGTMTVTVFHGVFNSPYAIVDAQTDNTYICFQQAFYGDPVHGSNIDANLACNMFSIDGNGERLFLRGNAGTNAVALRILKSRLDVSGAVDPSNPTTQEWIDAFTAWNDAGNTLIEYTYTMQTPIIVPLTPTQIYSLSQPDPYNPRINTVYSDQVSVQVGYPKSPQATQNELTSAIVSLGGNV